MQRDRGGCVFCSPSSPWKSGGSQDGELLFALENKNKNSIIQNRLTLERRRKKCMLGSVLSREGRCRPVEKKSIQQLLNVSLSLCVCVCVCSRPLSCV